MKVVLRHCSYWYLCVLALTVSSNVGGGVSAAARLTDPSVELVAATDSWSVAQAALSGDGRYVAFVSDADDIVPNDTNGVSDVFVRDRRTNAVTRVSVATGGRQADGASVNASISADGRRVVFATSATNLDSASNPHTGGIYLYDRSTRRTTFIAEGGSPVISGDGRFAAFVAASHDHNIGRSHDDVFVREIASGRTEVISVPAQAGVPDNNSDSPSISHDGRVVAFRSEATNLVAGDSNGTSDVFVRDRVARTTLRANVSSTGVQAEGWTARPSLSSSGSIVVFSSSATNLVAGDTNRSDDIFVRDLAHGTTTRVSVDSFGLQADGGSNGAVVSADGRVVAFASEARNLVNGGISVFGAVFVHDRSLGVTEQIDVEASGRQPEYFGWGPSISSDGRIIAFLSYAALVPQDTHTHGPDFYIRDRGTGTVFDRLHELDGSLQQINATRDLIASLHYNLELASGKAADNDRTAACRVMFDVVNEVQDAWNRNLPTADAARLFSAAEQIERGLGCRPAPTKWFVFRKTSVPLPRRSAPAGFEFGDVNGDGAIDAVVRLSGRTSGVFLLLGDRLGSFPTMRPLPVTLGAWVLLADIDGDGRSDIVAPQHDPAQVAISLSRGTARNPTFVTTTTPLPSEVGAITVGDITGDRMIDIVTANAQTGYVTVLAGIGGGRFAAPAQIWSDRYADTIRISDVDKDGYPDLLVGRWNSLAVVRGSSQGFVGGYWPIAYGAFSSFALADLNGDNRDDLISTEASTFRVMLNTAGRFADSDVIERPEYSVLDTADFDSDGRIDVAVHNTRIGAVVVHRGNGDGTFGVHETFRVGGRAWGLATADLNHDSTVDLAFARVTSVTGAAEDPVTSELTVLMNQPRVVIETWNDPQRFGIGTMATLTWQHALPTGAKFRVEVSRDGGRRWTTLQSAVAAPGGRGRLVWNVTGPATTAGRVRVVAVGDSTTAADMNNALFEISPAEIHFTTVGGDVTWGIGTHRQMGWGHNLGTGQPVTFDLSRDDGVTWTRLASDVATRGSSSSSLLWTVAGPATARARLRVQWSTNPSVGVVSARFAIADPFIEMTWPLHGDTVHACAIFRPTWKHNLGVGDAARVELSIDRGRTWQSFGTVTAGIGRGTAEFYKFTPGATTNALFRVTWSANPAVSALTGPFTITAAPFDGYCD
jgi:Tol biopolymer transport system component